MPIKPELNRQRLLELLACHATPGDEAEVRDALERAWRNAGWKTARLGELAVTASDPQANPAAPILLVCAHMDSPGYAVQAFGPADGAADNDAPGPCWRLTPLGQPAFSGIRVPGALKYAGGVMPVMLTASASGTDGDDEAGVAGTPAMPLPRRLLKRVRHGDRVCFAATPTLRGNRIAAPFLDNRLGCWLVAELPRLAARWRPRFRIVVAATAGEEFTGHGAAVLAHQVRPALTIVLDATYQNRAQRVEMGQGPVLTLSDRSVLIPPAWRDRLLAGFARAGIPLQTEVYNYSGTDARAFPLQGIFTPVLPLLIATTGNHTPRETADLRDAEHVLRAIRCLAENPPRL